MKTQAILATAGTGTRLKGKIAKPLIRLNGKPLFVFSLEVFEKSPAIHSVIVVAHPARIKDFEKFIQRYRLKKVKHIVAGGANRCDSVRHGLEALDPDTAIVVIHDGARPLVTPRLILDLVSAMKQEKAATAAVPVKATIKQVDPKNLLVQKTLPRETLWEIQTPQVFHKDVILKAHEKMLCCKPADDAVLVEKIGVKVKIVKGDYQNIKITTSEDLNLARAFLDS